MKKLIICLLLGTSLQAKVLLWDLGGVLFNPDKLGVAEEIGLSHFVSYFFHDLKNPNIQHVLFEVLEMMMKPEKGIREKAGTAEGQPLPTIMCHWQAGTITGREIIKASKRHIKKLAEVDYFESAYEQNLIQETIKGMFDPYVLARNVYPVEAGFQLVRECCQVRDKNGKKKHRHFIFSNWDHLSFDIFYRWHKHLFQYFEAIVISGHMKRIKPRPESYEYLLKQYNLDPKDCILIDDQEVNATGARKCGMQAVLIHNGDYKQLRNDLKKLGVFQ